MNDWWRTFFDGDYRRLWAGMVGAEYTRSEVDGLVRVLRLTPGQRVLDAPCGYGRISRPLAERGLEVLGVDQSATLVAIAQKEAADRHVPLRYRQHDLRQPLPDAGFDAALNIFSSIGYGSEEDDLAVLTHLAAALRPGGKLLVDTQHRDAVVARIAKDAFSPSSRLPDGTLLVEEPRFDPVSGRVDTTWYWSGPGGAGQRSASLRVYTATELMSLFRRAGLRDVKALRGYSEEPFRLDSQGGGRLVVVGER